MKGAHHITRRLSYHNLCSFKQKTFIIKQTSYCGNGVAYQSSGHCQTFNELKDGRDLDDRSHYAALRLLAITFVISPKTRIKRGAQVAQVSDFLRYCQVSCDLEVTVQFRTSVQVIIMSPKVKPRPTVAINVIKTPQATFNAC